jgi:Arc/MetJ-type ribon-helix-helix transcriptional regulator
MVDEAETTQVMVRLTPDLKKKIKDQIDKGRFTTYADFMKSAAIEKLIRLESEDSYQIDILEVLDRPDVRQKLKEIWIGFLTELR